jgi:hypothetical protein
MQDIAIFQLIVMILMPDSLFTFRKKYNFALQKAMIFGQKMTIIIITIRKHHNSKHKIPLYNIPRMLTKHF